LIDYKKLPVEALSDYKRKNFYHKERNASTKNVFEDTSQSQKADVNINNQLNNTNQNKPLKSSYNASARNLMESVNNLKPSKVNSIFKLVIYKEGKKEKKVNLNRSLVESSLDSNYFHHTQKAHVYIYQF